MYLKNLSPQQDDEKAPDHFIYDHLVHNNQIISKTLESSINSASQPFVYTISQDLVHELDDTHYSRFNDIIIQYQDALRETEPATDSSCHITTTGPPIQQRPYRRSLQQQDQIEIMVTKLLEEGIIEESHSPWSSPIVLVPKKNGETRMCIDYRQLNEVTTTDAYPLPNIDDIMAAVGKTKPMYFSLIDLKGSFHQLELHPGDKNKTTDCTNTNVYLSDSRMPHLSSSDI